jgi:hypothetical protein
MLPLRLLLAGATFCALGAQAVAQQSAAAPTKTGVLSCQTSASLGLIVGSHQKLRCQFRPDVGRPENYVGTINRLGLDLGITAGGALAWAVLAPTNQLGPGALSGKYVGASGDISLGVGAGANLLIGGSNKTVSLQPLSVEGQVGVNLALGVAGLTLQHVR